MNLLNPLLARVDRLLARCQPRGFYLRQLRAREKYRPDYEILAAALHRHLKFETVLDVGCANGFLLDALQRAGKQVAGLDRAAAILEVLPEALRTKVRVGDFSEAQGQYDLVCCVEVAEHLPPDRSIELVEKLISLARLGIYFSAAPPGQIGLGHVNSRPHVDWLRWFEERGWKVDGSLTDSLRHDLARMRKTFWLKRNGFIIVPARVPQPGQSPRSRAQATGATSATTA